MPFNWVDNERAGIGAIYIALTDRDGTVNGVAANAQIDMLNASGQETGEQWQGSIIDFIPQQHKANLWAFLQWVRAEAETRLIEP